MALMPLLEGRGLEPRKTAVAELTSSQRRVPQKQDESMDELRMPGLIAAGLSSSARPASRGTARRRAAGRPPQATAR